MGYEIRFLDSALEDVDSIIVYLSQFYPSTPQKFLDALERCTVNLKNNPVMYALYPDNPAFRRVVLSDYLVFYKVDEEKSLVEIYRILHGSRNLSQNIPEQGSQ
ncbi:conserved plasmid protein [Treponema primitia ZAS-2]|uniref:Conserved plasmid protein n=2 Tax=Treponema primitia TaxID=88058 RepID=F5YMX5_TREPZ|nr:conserved plasmid protein [Treponema primitia ZAS-2]